MTDIKVSKCDNELYIIASQGSGSSELLHIKSGYNNPVSNALTLESILPKGAWNITLVGINWGGPWEFNVLVGNQPFSSAGSDTVGVVFNKTVAVTI